MSGFDDAVILFLNRLARASWTFDTVADFVSRSNLLKGGVITALFWWLWFRRSDDEQGDRSHIIATLAAAMVAIVLARTLALTLPFRVRPLHDEDLGFVLPWGTPADRLEPWSAFPSDHAVLFFALATGLWFVSRTVGALATVYVSIMIALPRLYLGLHYPTDILAGAAIGAAITIGANTAPLRRIIADPALRWLRASPGSFYTVFYLVSFQVAVLFGDGREFAGLVYRLIRPHL